MIENSSAGLEWLAAEVAVMVTREEHHQPVLARYPVPAGGQRRVAVELGWCTIGSGKHRGQPAIEVRLDGLRVGELTHAMSQRYGPLVSQIASRGGQPGCEAVIRLGAKGLEVVLRLPRHTDGAVPNPPPTLSAPAFSPDSPELTSVTVPMARIAASPVPSGRRGNFSSHRSVWIGGVVVAVLLLFALASNHHSPSATTARTQLGAATTAPTTTTVLPLASTQPTTTSTTTTEVASAAAPTASRPPSPAPSPTTRRTTTTQAAPAVPVPHPATEQPKPRPACDPNYSGCVPVASDVDCEGGGGNGPAYVRGPIQVIGKDIYGLDRDGDGTACE